MDTPGSPGLGQPTSARALNWALVKTPSGLLVWSADCHGYNNGCPTIITSQKGAHTGMYHVEPTAHVMSRRHSSAPDRVQSSPATGDATFPNEEQFLQELASDSFPTRGTLLDARESAPVRFLKDFQQVHAEYKHGARCFTVVLRVYTFDARMQTHLAAYHRPP